MQKKSRVFFFTQQGWQMTAAKFGELPLIHLTMSCTNGRLVIYATDRTNLSNSLRLGGPACRRLSRQAIQNHSFHLPFLFVRVRYSSNTVLCSVHYCNTVCLPQQASRAETARPHDAASIRAIYVGST